MCGNDILIERDCKNCKYRVECLGDPPEEGAPCYIHWDMFFRANDPSDELFEILSRGRKHKVHESVKEELLDSEFYKSYKEDCEFNKMGKMSDEAVLCELIYDLIRELSIKKGG